MTENEKKVFDTLDELGISYVRHEHEPVFTIEEGSKLDTGDGRHCKNLFLRNIKGDSHYLLIVDNTKRIELKNLSKLIGSTALSLASEERLFRYLGLTRGAVSPFGLLNDRDREVKVLIDRDLTGRNKLCFHPNVNTATVIISFHDLKRFLDRCGNEICYVQV
ncbi:MAG: prolyl-tRNA synthetase associated domain-containing protein [Thermacetogeniaceae bacterium]